jgi:glycosyltransferase involved in cell wall biosynthesis
MENLKKCFEHIEKYNRNGVVAVDRCHNLFLMGALLSKKPENVLELGIGAGFVTWSLIHALRFNRRGKLTCVDNWFDWGGIEPEGIDEIRAAGVNVVAPIMEEEFVKNCPSDAYDFLISDADPFLSGLWVDEHLRITKLDGFMFFHKTNRKEDYPNLQLIEKRIKELGLFYYHFTESSRTDERCTRGWLFAINNKKHAEKQANVRLQSRDDRFQRPSIDSGKKVKPEPDKPVGEALYLGLIAGENYGWGVCSSYLIKELSRRRNIHVLNEDDGSATNRALNGKLFQALASVAFFGMFDEARGKANYGYTFFESELTSNSVENAKKYDLVMGGSSWCKDRMLEKGINNCGVLIQGVDSDYFYPITEEKNPDDFVIFSGGKFELRKGQDILLKAIKILQERYNDIFMVNSWYNIWPESMQLMAYSKHIKYEYKEGPWPEVMNHIYEINGLDPSRIKTYELVSNATQRELFKTSDIGVFPNRCEGGTNLVLMEYMACAKPVIVSNASGHKDVVTEENALLLNDLGNINLVDAEGKLVGRWQEPSLDELVAGIEYAYHHREEVRKIGEKAGEDMKNYTWDHSARQLLNILDN